MGYNPLQVRRTRTFFRRGIISTMRRATTGKNDWFRGYHSPGWAVPGDTEEDLTGKMLVEIITGEPFDRAGIDDHRI